MRAVITQLMCVVAVAGTFALAGPPSTASAAPAACPPAGPVAYVGPTATAGGQKTITPINTATNKAGQKIKVGLRPGPYAVTPNGKTIYVISLRGSTVTPFSTCTGVAGRPIKVGLTPTAIAITPNGRTAYVVNDRSNSVTPISIATNKALTPITVGVHPKTIVITPDSQTAYVTNAFSDSVTPIQVATNTALTPIPVGRHPDLLTMSPDGTIVLVGNLGGTFVNEISTATNKQLADINVGFAASSLAITPDDKTAYAGSSTDFKVVPMDLVTSTALKPIGLDGPDALAIAPDGKTLYAADYWGSSAYAIRVSSDTVIGRIHTGSLSDTVAISPNGKTAYVVNNVYGTVTAISTATNKALKNLKAGGHPLYIVMAPFTARTVPPGTASTSGSWAKATTLPAGTGTPGVISCSSPGTCAVAGGSKGAVYVVSQLHGTWGRPKLIPGTARTFKPSSGPAGISCSGAGDCVVAGTYLDSAGHNQAFIATEVRGTWRKLLWVPGLAKLDQGNSAGLGELSCPSAGNCTAAGSYNDKSGITHPFTVSETKGSWGQAVTVPGLSSIPGQRPDTVAGFGPISCASAGNCAAGGNYAFGAPHSEDAGTLGFVDDEVHGVWGTPETVPGLAALNTGLYASMSVIACPSAGHCTAGGTYPETEGNSDSFTVGQVNGTWGTATEVTTSIPGFNGPDGDYLTALSCPSAGNCVAGGVDNVEHDALAASPFIITESHGTWGQAVPVPGTNQLNQGDQSQLNQVSCSSAGNCGVAGYISVAYDYGFVYTQPFVATEVNGTWSKAIVVPGVKTLSLSVGGGGSTDVISCTAPGRCSAGGYGETAKGAFYGFVDSRS